jgi:hypothetical protein
MAPPKSGGTTWASKSYLGAFVRFGPLSKIDVETLKDQLEQRGASCKIEVSQPHVEQAKLRVHEFQLNRTYTGDSAYFFLEIDSKDVLIIRGTLEKMGISVYSTPPEPLPEVPEYLCLDCKFVSEFPGTCPKHGRPLYEFSSWVAAKNKRSERTWRPLYILLLLALVGLAIYQTLTPSGLKPLVWFSTFRF